MFAPADPRALVRRMADPRVHVVTLTVTEKGYCHDPATGRLDLAHPDVRHDLAHPDEPRVGGRVCSLPRSTSDGAPGPARSTSCAATTCRTTGACSRGSSRRTPPRATPELANWIATHAAFPCTMVDRIVPATTDADLRRRRGERSACTTRRRSSREPWIQWVIENRFVAAASRLGGGGRRDRGRRRAVRDDEAAAAQRQPLDARVPGLPRRARDDRAGGRRSASSAASSRGRWPRRSCRRSRVRRAPTSRATARRSSSASATRRCRTGRAQIAMDGSQKLPQRLLGTVRDRLAGGGSIRHLTLAVAGWMRYASGVDEHGARIDVADPMAARYAEIAAAAHGDPVALAHGFLGIDGDLRRGPAREARVRRRGDAPPGVARPAWCRRDARRPSRARLSRPSRAQRTFRMPALASLHPDRLFPADPTVRALGALALRDGEGPADRQPARPHRPALVRRRTRRSATRARCFITPDHYVFRMLYSQGVRLEALGIPRHDGGPVETDARKIWRTFAAHYHLFRGTPTRLWLDHAFSTVFGIDERLSPANADAIFDAHQRGAARRRHSGRARCSSASTSR